MNLIKKIKQNFNYDALMEDIDTLYKIANKAEADTKSSFNLRNIHLNK